MFWTLPYILGFLGKFFGKSKNKSDIYNMAGKDMNATNSSATIFMASPCPINGKQNLNGEPPKSVQRNANRISELQHQNINLVKRIHELEKKLLFWFNVSSRKSFWRKIVMLVSTCLLLCECEIQDINHMYIYYGELRVYRVLIFTFFLKINR